MSEPTKPVKPVVPEGFKLNAKGSLDPISKIKPIDFARDDLVLEIFSQASELHKMMKEFKNLVFANIAAFVEISAEEYGVKLGGKKGNVTLVSYDGKIKIQRAYADHLVFDERLQAAKALIDECLIEWTDGANDNIRVLINGAFEVSKEGKINTNKVLALRQYKIDHPKWRKAMDIISDSLRIAGTKAYVRIYERVGDTDQYEAICLDLATL